MAEVVYPCARRDETVVDVYHGHTVLDPYRWLEDPDSRETQEFAAAQNSITQPYLEKCPCRKQISDMITKMWDYEKFGCPSKHGEKWFHSYNTGLQNQSIIYMQDDLDGEAKVLIDPNTLSEEGTTSISIHEFSVDGKYLAYCLSEGGSDWISIKIRRTDTAEDLDEVLDHVKFTSLAWTHDNLGFFYNAYPGQKGKKDGTETTSNLNQILCYHWIGTKQDKDVVCAKFPDHPRWTIGAEVSDCGKYLIYTPREGCDPVNRLYISNLTHLTLRRDDLLPFEKIMDNFDAEYEYITNEGTLFTFKTNLNSPRYKLITIDMINYSQENWKTLVPQDDDDVIQWAICINKDKLVLCYLHDVKSVLHIHSNATGERLATLPLDIGNITGYSGMKIDTEFFYQFISFLSPGTIYQCSMEGNEYKPKVYKETKVENFYPSLFQTTQVFYPAKDDPNTKIPMFIIHRKGIEQDGSHPLLLYGYGGFSSSICPGFSVSRIVLINNLGGVVAIPNIRGGGEYGETWHKAGMLKNKQNVFDDFQAAAEYLIQHKYTSSNRIVMNGASNGGLLVAACANQRPDLFACGIAQVGVMDMLRFHKFTIGHAWTSDYGCSDKKEDFEYLIKYSPLHNVNSKSGIEYPATLLLTADHDDRVVPLHSLKLTAQLQNEYKDKPFQKKPILIKVDTKSGHGGGKPTCKTIEELTDIQCFMVCNLKLQWRD